MRITTVNLWFWFIKKLPKKLIYFCALQLGAETTTGKHGDTIVPELGLMEAVNRYEKLHGIH